MLNKCKSHPRPTLVQSVFEQVELELLANTIGSRSQITKGHHSELWPGYPPTTINRKNTNSYKALFHIHTKNQTTLHDLSTSKFTLHSIAKRGLNLHLLSINPAHDMSHSKLIINMNGRCRCLEPFFCFISL